MAENQDFKNLLEYIKFIVTITFTWLGLMAGIFFFFLWQDRQDMQQQVTAIKDEASESIQKVNNSTISAINSLKNSSEKKIEGIELEAQAEARRRVDQYFRSNNIELILQEIIDNKLLKFEKKVDIIRAESREADEIITLIEKIKTGESLPIQDLRRILKASTSKDNKNLIWNAIDEMLQHSHYTTESYKYFKDKEKNKTAIRKYLNEFEENIEVVTTIYKQWCLGDHNLDLRIFFDYHFSLNLYFGTKYDVFEYPEILKLCEKKLKDFRK